MKIYKEIKQIAKKNAQIKYLLSELSKTNLDLDGIMWDTAEFVTLSKEDIKAMKDDGGEDESYYVQQWTGYACDDYHGYLYFKTDVPAQYVKVYYNC